jgi:hypothetical protein
MEAIASLRDLRKLVEYAFTKDRSLEKGSNMRMEDPKE